MVAEVKGNTSSHQWWVGAVQLSFPFGREHHAKATITHKSYKGRLSASGCWHKYTQCQCLVSGCAFKILPWSSLSPECRGPQGIALACLWSSCVNEGNLRTDRSSRGVASLFLPVTFLLLSLRTVLSWCSTAQ